jgi:O-methyltransferase involved in polyketide biosynthesis
MLPEASTLLQGAAESLFLPLCSRALETRRAAPIVRDEKAVELVAQLDYDFERLAGLSLYHTIICLRVRRFDAELRAFLGAYPSGTIVNIGCGLDTRYERVDNGKAHWLELDLPEVIRLRRRMLPQTPRRRFLAASAVDTRWLDEVGPLAAPVLFFAEGVFMFLDGEDVRRLVMAIASRFPGSRLLFDAVKPLEVALRRLHPALRRTSAVVRWGLAAGSTPCRWAPGIRLEREWHYCDEPEPRLGIYRLLRYAPGLLKTAWILRYRLGSGAAAGRQA